MKKIILSMIAVTAMSVAILSCTSQKETANAESKNIPNSLTPEQTAEGWQLLFDGESLKGWKRFNHDTVGPLWSVEDGAILCDGEGLGEGSGDMGGSLVTTKEFGNFDLILDYKLSPGGNSGILYHVDEDPKYKYDYETGPEFQLLDDSGWKGELREEQKAGGNYDMYAAAASKKVNPAGEWNTARIVYYNGHVEHYLNGDKVVEFEEDSDDFRSRHNNSKWKEYPDWNKTKSGAIALQDHGAPVYFKNIRIKEL
ncbi:MAG: DUF1080 domain-containing protein [Cyclobacteriaceae bacterium]